MTDDLAQRLLNLKERIEQARSQADRLEGQIGQLEHQRATELGCSSDEEAEEYRRELEEEIARLNQELAEGLKTIEEELGWTGS